MSGRVRVGNAARPRSGSAGVDRLLSSTTTSRRVTENGRARAAVVEVVVGVLALDCVAALFLADPPQAIRLAAASAAMTR